MYRLIAHVIVCSGLYSMSCRVPRWVVRFVKNNLQYILDWYIKEGIFPSKLRWKIILTSNIFRPDKRVTLEFLTNVFPNYSVFSSGTVNCNNCSIQNVTKTHPKLAPLFPKLVKITGMTVPHGFTHHRLLCGLLTDHILMHKLCFCVVNHERRCKLWDAIITCCGYNVFIRLSKLDPQQQCKSLINTVLQCSADEWEFNKLLIALCNTVFCSRDQLCLLDMTFGSSQINRQH